MSYIEELEQDLVALRNSTELNIDELMRISALQERAKIFQKIVNLIQEKDAANDPIAAEVLSWAWQKLSD